METQPTYHTPRNAPASELERMDFTFTRHSLVTIRAFRSKISAETGRRVTLAMALDALIKSHPFGQTSGDSKSHADEVSSADAPCYLHLRPNA